MMDERAEEKATEPDPADVARLAEALRSIPPVPETLPGEAYLSGAARHLLASGVVKVIREGA